MKYVKIIIGANYGNEGKGLIIDYLCRKASKTNNILNVKLTGSYNSGHKVVTDDKRYVFRQIGAGSFNDNVDTYLGKDFVLNAKSLLNEINELNVLGVKDLYNRIFINKDTLINLEVDKLLGEKRDSKGESKRFHTKSASVGLWETIERNKNSEYSLKFGELVNGDTYIIDKLNKIKNEYSKQKLIELGYTDNEIDSMFESLNIDLEYKDLKFVWDNIKNIERDELLIRSYDLIVFEGNHGLMVDSERKSEKPYISPLRTGLNDIAKLINESSLAKENIEVCYVTRSYIHRRGPGNLNNEVSNYKEISCSISSDEKRFGFIDDARIEMCIKEDLEEIKDIENKEISLCITHLDETDGMIATTKGRVYLDELAFTSMFNKIYMSFGDKAQDVIIEDYFNTMGREEEIC